MNAIIYARLGPTSPPGLAIHDLLESVPYLLGAPAQGILYFANAGSTEIRARSPAPGTLQNSIPTLQ